MRRSSLPMVILQAVAITAGCGPRTPNGPTNLPGDSGSTGTVSGHTGPTDTDTGPTHTDTGDTGTPPIPDPANDGFYTGTISVTLHHTDPWLMMTQGSCVADLALTLDATVEPYVDTNATCTLAGELQQIVTPYLEGGVSESGTLGGGCRLTYPGWSACTWSATFPSTGVIAGSFAGSYGGMPGLPGYEWTWEGTFVGTRQD